MGGALNALLQGHSIFAVQYLLGQGFPDGTSGKEPGCQCRRCKRCGFDPWVGKIPWRRAWQPIPVFLPGKFHGQRSLAGCTPWGHKESDTTEHMSINFFEILFCELSFGFMMKFSIVIAFASDSHS